MLERTHPLPQPGRPSPQCAGVVITAEPLVTRILVRATAASAIVLGNILHVTLPMTPCRSSGTLECAALWLGPDEWLVLANRMIAIPTARPAVSIVDISHAMAGITLQGPRAAWVINAHCALDLHDKAFPRHMCTRTVFGKAQIVLWRPDNDVFRIEVARSFAPYVWDLLEEARREFLT